jgi:hypothetical protein
MNHGDALTELGEQWGFAEDDAIAMLSLATNLGWCAVACFPGKPVTVRYLDEEYTVTTLTPETTQ